MAKPEKVLASELLEREVVDLQAGAVVGAVVDFAVAREGRVMLLGVLPLDWFSGGLGIAPAAIASVTHERVCISDSAALTGFAPGTGETALLTFDRLQNKTVVEQDGNLLGTLTDFSFMCADGQITDLVVLDSASDRRSKVAIESIRCIGSDFIVIQRNQSAATIAAAVPEPVAAAKLSPAPVEETAAASAASQAGAAAELDSGIIEHGAARIAETAEAEAEASALFVAAPEPGKLSKFDQKKVNYLRGKPAHRDLVSSQGELLVAKGTLLDDPAITLLVQHELLSEVFVEMTVNR